MSLLTSLIVRNCHIFAGFYLVKLNSINEKIGEDKF